MSIESKIENLTKAIEALTVVLLAPGAKASDATPTETKKVKTEPEPEPEVVETKTAKPEPTHADLKAACLKVARDDKKDQVKALLADYGAAKAVDVAVELLEEVITKIEAL